jgi:hypothetical protein
MPPAEDVEPVTAVEAADRLDRAASTIRCWALRYNARQLRKIGKRVYYDFADLAVIHRELRHGHTVPASPEERAAIRLRCPLKSELTAAA